MVLLRCNKKLCYVFVLRIIVMPMHYIFKLACT